MSETTNNDKRPMDDLSVPCGQWRRLFPSPVLIRLADDRRGVIIVMFALMLPILLGFMGLGVEVALWYSTKRDMQAAADAAAIAAAYEIAESRASNATARATAEAQNNGWSSTTGSITINNSSASVNSTFPTSGAFTADSNAVEVLVTKNVTRLFSAWFFDDNTVTVNGRAVAQVQNGAADACVLALAAGDPGQAVKVAGASTNVTLNGCSIAVNSTDNQALKNTSGNLTADCIYIEGSGGFTGSPTTTKCSGPKSGQAEVADPYADIEEPTGVSCDFNDYRVPSDSGIVSAGTYCGGIKMTSGSLDMGSGLYIMDEGNFEITGGDVSGTDVTIVLMDSSGNNSCGIFKITGGGSLDLTATSDTSDTYAGILVFRHATCSSTQGDMTFTGNSSSVIAGVIYAPSKEVKFSGGTSVTGSCLQIVADTVEFSGSGTLGSDCDAFPAVKEILVGGIGVLVE